jgi:hypothetical protein
LRLLGKMYDVPLEYLLTGDAAGLGDATAAAAATQEAAASGSTNGEAVPAAGEWHQLVPRSLHVQLTELAKREGVSLPLLVTMALTEFVSRRAL